MYPCASSRAHQDPNRLEIGEPRWRVVVRLLIWLSVVVLYYVTLVPIDAADAGRMNNASLHWVLLVFPLFLTPYLFGIIQTLRDRELFVFDGVAGDLRRDGIAIIRLDQITDVCLEAVNGTCEELSLSVRGEDNFSVDLPVDGPPARVAEVGSAIASMANVQVRFIQS